MVSCLILCNPDLINLSTPSFYYYGTLDKSIDLKYFSALSNYLLAIYKLIISTKDYNYGSFSSKAFSAHSKA